MRVFGHLVRGRILTLLAVESLAIIAALSLLATMFVRSSEGPSALTEAVYLPAALICLLMVALGAYEPEARARLPVMGERLAAAALVGAALSFLALYLLSNMWISPLYAAAAAGVSYGAGMATRFWMMRIARLSTFQRRVLALGDDEGLGRLEAAFDKGAVAGFSWAGRVNLAEANADARLRALLEEADAAEIVVSGRRDAPLPVGALLDARMQGRRVLDWADFYERETGRVDLANLYPQRFIFMETGAYSRLGRLIKRAADVAVSLAALTLASPLLAGAVVAIKLDDGGPIFYRQTRTGLGGAPFEIFKLRSMSVDAEKGGAQWAQARDPRITRVGGFLRRSRIDELPQLWNVLKGEMSLVGPRPERPVFVEKLAAEIPFYNDRHRVKPGLTGWAQINYPYGASVEDARAKLEYDLYYMKKANLALDLFIMLKTARVVLWPEGVR